VLPADKVEALERLVDEVERVSRVGEYPLGLGRKQGICEHSRRNIGRNRRKQGALGRLAMAHLCPTPQPALERGRFRSASKRRTFPPRRLAVAVRRHAARAVEQGEISFLLSQHGQEIGERGEDRETHAPAVAVLRPEQRHLPHDVGPRYVGRELTMHGLGDDEPDVMCEAVRKPLMPVRSGIGMTERGLHPDVAIAHLDRADRYIVRPEVESAAAFEVEAGVVPMTGQDAVLDASALKWEAHVRATIVECEDAPAVVDDEDRTMTAVHNELPLRLQLLKAHRQREFLVRRVHEHTSPSRLFGVAAGTPIKRQHRHPLAQTRKVAVIQGLRETRSITFPRYIYGLRS
jgi:hypothetical protein